jgi:hypothetical protein
MLSELSDLTNDLSRTSDAPADGPGHLTAILATSRARVGGECRRTLRRARCSAIATSSFKTPS